MKYNTTVLVTGIGGGALGEQLIKALRLSDTVQYRIIGTDVTTISKGFPDVDIAVVVPFASAPGYIDTLLQVCIEHDVKVLLPGSEPEMKVISQHREQFESKGIFLPINSAKVLDTCFDKFKTVDFLRTQGFRFPKSVKIRLRADLDTVDFFPAVLKPSVGGSGSANIMIAQTPDELIVFGTYLLNIYEEYIIQEYVGTPDSEYTVGVLCSMEGELINSIALRRKIDSGLGSKIKISNRTGKKDLGTHLVISSGISQGEVGRFEEITNACEKMALALGAQSAVNIQCRHFKNEIYVFEINPRFSGTTSLRAMMGYNEPDVLIRKYLFGEEISVHFPYRSGIIMRGLSEAIVG